MKIAKFGFLFALTLFNSSIALAQNSTPKEEVYYAQETTNEKQAASIKDFLQKYLKNDLQFIEPENRNFSFYAIDMNGDKKPEYFVSMKGSYFCGTGGCNFLLLSNDFKLINNFTVMNEPIFRSSHKTKGWNDIILYGAYDKNGGVKSWVHLKYDAKRKKYPSNPSMVKPIPIAPNGHDFTMWYKDYAPAKEFSYDVRTWPKSLPVFGNGYPKTGDACRNIGENPLTNNFLDDSAILVGCLNKEDAAKLGGKILKEIDGVTLVSVPTKH